jgi:hypothetical protein
VQPDPGNLLRSMVIKTPLVGFYDAPDARAFEPLFTPRALGKPCVFAGYERWLRGETLLVTREDFGCRGAGYWLCGAEGRSRDELVRFLVDDEGLRSSYDLANRWLDRTRPYRMEHANILIGPLRRDEYRYLKTVTFYVDPDRLSLLVVGAHYDSSPSDPTPVLAPFGSGCAELAALFEDLDVPRAVIGGTDLAMRGFLPPNLLAFTVTKPMFERLCRLDERSFLSKPFWTNLRRARGLDNA